MPVILPPIREKTVKLHLPLDQDPDQEAYIKVRHATTAEQEQVADLMASENLLLNQDGSPSGVEGRVSMMALRRLQSYLTLSDCNFVDPDPDHPQDRSKDTPVFTFRNIGGKMRYDGNEEKFKAAWGTLPEDWSAAVVEGVLEVNPQWLPRPE